MGTCYILYHTVLNSSEGETLEQLMKNRSQLYLHLLIFIINGGGRAPKRTVVHFKCSASCSNSTLLLEFEAINQ